MLHRFALIYPLLEFLCIHIDNRLAYHFGHNLTQNAGRRPRDGAEKQEKPTIDVGVSLDEHSDESGSEQGNHPKTGT